jgi:HAD superfamily hydrolase (TIGR01509 family)
MTDAASSCRPFVLLDWDNTLHDSARANLAALRDVLAEYDLRVSREDYLRAYTTDHRELYRRLGLADALIDDASRRWRALVARARPRLLPGVDDALERLASAGYRLGLLTSSPRAVAEAQVRALGLAARFSVAVFGDDQPPRPDPAPLVQALDLLGADPLEAALCSDTTADMAMAGSVGAWAVGIASFAFDAAALTAAGADETAPSFAAWAFRQPVPAPRAVAPRAGKAPG